MAVEAAVYVLIVYMLDLYTLVAGEYCLHTGHSCSSPYRCCGKTCCLPDNYEGRERYRLRWSIWNMWYFWFFVIFILMLCFGGCGYWRRRQIMMAQQHALLQTRQLTLPSHRGCHQAALNLPVYAAEPDPPPVQEPQGSFPSPPPYAEVISKDGQEKDYKDLLPPYPGGPILTAEDINGLPRRDIRSDVGRESSLPPYASVGVEAPPPYQQPSQESQPVSITPSEAATEYPACDTGRSAETMPYPQTGGYSQGPSDENMNRNVSGSQTTNDPLNTQV